MDTEKELVAQHILFVTNEQLYALDITQVQTIEKLKHITRVPKTPSCIKGIINLRGEIIPIIDFRMFLTQKPIESTDLSRMIIVKVANNFIGLLVDSVKEVSELTTLTFDSEKSLQERLDAKYVTNVANTHEDTRVVSILDLEAVLNDAFHYTESDGGVAHA